MLKNDINVNYKSELQTCCIFSRSRLGRPGSLRCIQYGTAGCSKWLRIMGLVCSRVEVCVGLRPRGGDELNSTGLGEAPGSHRSFTSSSLEVLLSSPCLCHLHPPSAPAVLAIPAIRSSSSSELWRSMAGSSSNRTRRTRPGESRP